MKKYIILFIAAVTIVNASCGGGGGDTSDKKTNAPASAAKDISKDPNYQKGLDLVANNDCLTCHQVSAQGTGPAYKDVADKYDNSDSTINMLVNKIISGGSGHWGTVPMVSHPSLSKDDARQMVKYILLLKTK